MFIKPQDIIFFIVLGFIVYKQNPRWSASIGLICLLISIPLFYFWVFFTAERLTWYAAAFFLVSIFQYLFSKKKLI